jgi:hypothetical protein
MQIHLATLETNPTHTRKMGNCIQKPMPSTSMKFLTKDPAVNEIADKLTTT